MTTPVGVFGAPPDWVAWVALALGIVLGALAIRRAPALRVPFRSEAALVAGIAGLAAALSAGYVVHYLRGGPRIIDATSYYLEARSFAEGLVAMPVPSPTGSFRGRFLLPSDDGRALSVIFPPGYPALLALGFLAKAPLAVGPLLAATLVVITYALAWRLFADRSVARLAAALSALCAVLRYHTADTMSHGLAALLLTGALWAALAERRGMTLLSGFLGGWLVATRPVSGVVALALVVAVVRSPRRAVDVLIGATAPLFAFAFEQHRAVGAWFASSQSAYYALADAPEKCFRYGFGSGIGCRFEHGDFVRAHLEHGYGVVAALGTTLRRLKMHLADAGNTELFFPIVGYAIFRALRERKARAAALGVLGIVLGYVPFYFDGNYPGGGARFYADALPLEHVLLAWTLVELRFAPWAAPAALVGFALHTSFDHAKLAEREGGRPMFEPKVLDAAGIRRGLVLVATDHGYNLGFDPRALGERRDIVVARRRGDAHDTLLWRALGRPEAFAYDYDPGGTRASPSVSRLMLEREGSLRFEAEAEWPPLAVSGAGVEPVFPPCASKGGALQIAPSHRGDTGHMKLDLFGMTGSRRVRVGVVSSGRSALARFQAAGRAWGFDASGMAGCAESEGPVVDLRAGAFFEASVEAPLSIDYIELEAPAE